LNRASLVSAIFTNGPKDRLRCCLPWEKIQALGIWDKNTPVLLLTGFLPKDKTRDTACDSHGERLRDIKTSRAAPGDVFNRCKEATMDDTTRTGLFEKDGVRLAVEGCVRITSDPPIPR
jgi:hypothetical protein